MFLVRRLGLLILLTGILCGCSETEDVVLPEITVAFVAYEGTDTAKFLLTADPPNAGAGSFNRIHRCRSATFSQVGGDSEGCFFHTIYCAIRYIGLLGCINPLRFWEKSTKDYPISGFGLSADESFNGYVLGSPRRVTTQPFVVPDSVVPEPVLEEPVLEGRMYWVERMKIRRADLDGSNIQDLVTSSHRIERSNFYKSIALDVAGGKMYWADKEKIRRADLDGSNIQDIYTTGGEGQLYKKTYVRCQRKKDILDKKSY